MRNASSQCNHGGLLTSYDRFHILTVSRWKGGEMRFHRIALLCVALVSCAPSIVTYPVSVTRANPSAERFILLASVTGTSSAGFSRSLPAGTAFKEVGSIPQGRVMRPLNKILTAEGANIAEADAVVADGRWVGFYLRVEHTFSPLQQPVRIKLEKQS